MFQSMDIMVPERTQEINGKIAELRRRIAAAERSCVAPAGAGDLSGAVVSLGDSVLDKAFPSGGLPAGTLHEVTAAAYAHTPAAAGFAAALAARFQARRGGAVLWCEVQANVREFGALYGPGLARFGLDPARLVVVTARNGYEVLWVVEETLRTGALAGVVGEVPDAIDLTASRRLQLAAEAGGMPAFLVRGHEGAHALPPSAATTRWRIAGAPCASDGEAKGFGAQGALLGRPRWRAELVKCRHGRPADFLLEWNHETHRFDLASDLADRSLPAEPKRPVPAPAGARIPAVPLRHAG